MAYFDSQGRKYGYREHFPPEFSPFAYNDSIAAEHFPLSKEDILVYGGKFYETPRTEYETSVDAQQLPDVIHDAPEETVKELIACQHCKKAYRIIAPELQFLKQNNIPLPRYCVDCRHTNRIAQRNKSFLHERSCMCDKEGHGHVGVCLHTFKTSYSPDRPDIVYCESCYQKEVL